MLVPDRAKALEAVRKKKEDNAHLEQDFEDLPHWKKLASKYDFRLPAYYQPNTETKYVKRLFTKVGIDLKEYLEDCGVKTLKSLVAMNPTFPAYAEIGFALEWIDENIENYVHSSNNSLGNSA